MRSKTILCRFSAHVCDSNLFGLRELCPVVGRISLHGLNEGPSSFHPALDTFSEGE